MTPPLATLDARTSIVEAVRRDGPQSFARSLPGRLQHCGDTHLAADVPSRVLALVKHARKPGRGFHFFAHKTTSPTRNRARYQRTCRRCRRHPTRSTRADVPAVLDEALRRCAVVSARRRAPASLAACTWTGRIVSRLSRESHAPRTINMPCWTPHRAASTLFNTWTSRCAHASTRALRRGALCAPSTPDSEALSLQLLTASALRGMYVLVYCLFNFETNLLHLSLWTRHSACVVSPGRAPRPHDVKAIMLDARRRPAWSRHAQQAELRARSAVCMYLLAVCLLSLTNLLYFSVSGRATPPRRITWTRPVYLIARTPSRPSCRRHCRTRSGGPRRPGSFLGRHPAARSELDAVVHTARHGHVNGRRRRRFNLKAIVAAERQPRIAGSPCHAGPTVLPERGLRPPRALYGPEKRKPPVGVVLPSAPAAFSRSSDAATAVAAVDDALKLTTVDEAHDFKGLDELPSARRTRRCGRLRVGCGRLQERRAARMNTLDASRARGPTPGRGATCARRRSIAARRYVPCRPVYNFFDSLSFVLVRCAARPWTTRTDSRSSNSCASCVVALDEAPRRDDGLTSQ
ncbi:hypothetical protein FA95DRAFT_1423568 [Auriscalpium vulgare]|uniref:Uncharacterized protein n=1 Tax=Auriscalpium vulgare TaxID=40419 RepID=A0ACB8R0P0_9AGAM|nr:hypothetical protein FA95DRAFT_1423568 [Auriscalpium vulgare]